MFSFGNECSTISANTVSVLLLKPVDVFLSFRYCYTNSFSLRLNFPEPYEASNLKVSFSTAEIYNEIDTATLKCQVKIHTSAFGSLTAAMEEDTNQTSRQQD